jgi:hypothetical protein
VYAALSSSDNRRQLAQTLTLFKPLYEHVFLFVVK